MQNSHKGLSCIRKKLLEIVNLKLLDGKSTKLNILTILATGNDMFNVLGINILFIMIPVTVGSSLIILKKKNVHDGITEKLNFGKKFLT